jgi:hypothetical protein
MPYIGGLLDDVAIAWNGLRGAAHAVSRQTLAS